MSMLSMLIDRLRTHADIYDGRTEPPLAPELQRPCLAQELRDAADTIWQLRDDLQRANAENAKLRELVRDMNECLEHSKPLCKKCKFQELDCQWFKFIDRMAQLGVEVSE